MEIVGKGDEMVDVVLRDGSVSAFRVCDVLQVLKLGCPLISWRKLRSKGYTEFGEGDYISINKEIQVIFGAVFDGNQFKIPKTTHSAHATYDFWHQTCGHQEPPKMVAAHKLYSDADIPTKPMNYTCTSCITSKMTQFLQRSTSKKN